MLIEFRVKNFLSIRTDAVLSMVANSSKELRKTNVFEPSAKGSASLLRSAAMFGPNGSGKTNFVAAMRFMSEFVRNSALGSKPDDEIPTVPFMLDTESPRETSEFEAIFIADGVRYQYGFTADSKRIHEEWLYAAPEGRSQTWFERNYDEKLGEYSWKFGSHFRGQKQSIQSSTRENALFLTTATSLNNKQLRVVWRWFAVTLRVFSGNADLHEGYTARLCQDDRATKERILAFLKSASIAIEGITVVPSKDARETSPTSIFSESGDGESDDVEIDQGDTFFTHSVYDADFNVDFPIEWESAGTRNLFAWAGPLLETLDQGLVLAIDEIDASMHTLLAQYVIGLFHDPSINKNGAQLIFTSHSTPIMGNKALLRRDQVWFVAKDRLQGSCLRAFTDFQPRKGEDRERNYLKGRYGAIPALESVS